MFAEAQKTFEGMDTHWFPLGNKIEGDGKIRNFHNTI